MSVFLVYLRNFSSFSMNQLSLYISNLNAGKVHQTLKKSKISSGEEAKIMEYYKIMPSANPVL